MTRDRERSSSSGSSVANKQPPVFDISNESGMLALLRTIHRSGAKQATKNQLRDLLFGARGNDTTTQAKIISRLDEAGFKATFGGKNLASDSVLTGQESRPRGFGRPRMTPDFSTPQQRPADTLEVVEKPESPIESAPEIAIATPAKETDDIASQPPEPTAAPVLSAETPVSPSEQPLPETMPPSVESSPVPPQEGFKGDPMERIKEIKRTINERVGNPITLIDADNQIGREYMNALLSAMKVANGGRPEEVAEAMARLEQAYQGAIQVAKTALPVETDTDKFVQATAKPSVATDATPEATSVAPTPVETEPAPEPIVETPPTAVGGGSGFVAATPAEQSSPAEAEVSSPVVEKPLAGNPVKLNIKTDANPADSAVPPTPMKSAFIPEESPVEESEATTTSESELVKNNAPAFSPVSPGNVSVPQTDTTESAPAVESVSTDTVFAGNNATVPEASPEPPVTAPESPNRLMSVAKEEQLEKLMRQKKAESAEAEKSEAENAKASLDPLMIPEVTAGLKQLLSEWSLFKSSGFFGTGPGGVDHPLYKQMSGLTMAAVIAGRFEGATPQIKQSVTDYMNGWRYEEGIVHEHSETFEHYLRRVIKHILDNKEG